MIYNLLIVLAGLILASILFIMLINKIRELNNYTKIDNVVYYNTAGCKDIRNAFNALSGTTCNIAFGDDKHVIIIPQLSIATAFETTRRIEYLLGKLVLHVQGGYDTKEMKEYLESLNVTSEHPQYTEYVYKIHGDITISLYNALEKEFLDLVMPFYKGNKKRMRKEIETICRENTGTLIRACNIYMEWVEGVKKKLKSPQEVMYRGTHSVSYLTPLIN